MQANNHNPGQRGGTLADINTIPWVTLGEGVKFKLLRYCEVTGDWVLYVQLQPGVKFGRHKHITPAEFFITKGELVFERGSARAGVYGYEEIGEIHEEACGMEETEFLYTGHGPVAFIDKDDKFLFLADLEFYKNAAAGNLAHNIMDNKKATAAE
jgi:anti-sigma factor ChrR (cupin superfamily)